LLQANYFDGQSTRLRVVELSVSADVLTVTGEGIHFQTPFSQVSVDERLGSASRRLRFQDGAFCEVRDVHALDELLKAVGYRDGHVDRMQRHLRWVLVSTLLSIAVSWAAYKWGLPWAAAIGARHTPPAFGRALSTQTLRLMDGKLLLQSKMPVERRRALSAEFDQLRTPEGGAPESVLLFRRSPQFGSNAFTLPDGTIILLDDLVMSIQDDRQVMAVLAHELGHARGRHSLQLLLESSAIGAFWTFYAGDVSGLLAAAPAAMAQAKYSQSFEQAADDYAAALLVCNQMSPGLLADALETIARSHPELPSSADFLASHPSTAARLKRLRELAAVSKPPC
jgi:Zn-dependent protease with chaperone function